MIDINEECSKILEEIKGKLPIPVSSDKLWAKGIGNIAGVYIFFVNNVPKYVGETFDIKKRMEKFTGKSGHKGGYLKLKNLLGSGAITFKYLNVNFGRKEFEEWFYQTNPDLFNSKRNYSR